MTYTKTVNGLVIIAKIRISVILIFGPNMMEAIFFPRSASGLAECCQGGQQKKRGFAGDSAM